MRKFSTAAITVGLLFSALWLAWSQGVRSNAERQEQQKSTQLSVEQQERLGSALNWLSQSLSLTNAQRMTVRRIFLEEGRQIGLVREDRSLTPDQKRSHVLQLHQSTNYEIKSVLDPRQQEKFMNIERHTKEVYRGDAGAS